jgi:arylsulfatase A-like enzyme
MASFVIASRLLAYLAGGLVHVASRKDLGLTLLAGVVGTALADAWVTVHALDGEAVSAGTRVATFVESFAILFLPLLAGTLVLAWLVRRADAPAILARLRVFAGYGDLPPGLVAAVHLAVAEVALTQAVIRTRYVVSHLKPGFAAPVAVVVTAALLGLGVLVSDRLVRCVAANAGPFWSRLPQVAQDALARASYGACVLVVLMAVRELLPNDGEPFVRFLAVGALCALVFQLRALRGLCAKLSPRHRGAILLTLALSSAAAYPALAHLPGRVRTAVTYRSPMGSLVLGLVRSVRNQDALAPRSALAAPPVGHARSSSEARPAPPAMPVAKRPNLVVIQLDTVRPDRVGFGGYPQAHTPALDRFREGAVWFRSTYAPAPSTRYVMASIFTGVDGERARAKHPSQRLMLDPRARTLAEELEDLGYDRIGVTVPYILSQMPGYGRGFRVWESAWSIEHDDEPPRDTLDVSSADAILEHLEQSRSGRPYFVFGHFWCAHGPRPELDGDASRGYDAALEHCDAQLGRVLDAVDARPESRDTAVIIYSDHGEMLGEHGLSGHGTSLYEPAIRALLLARLPGVPAGVVEEPVSLAGVHAMVAKLAGAPAVLRDGEDLADLARGRPSVGPHPVFAMTDEQVGLLRFRAHAVIDGRTKYVREEVTGSELLFDLEKDPSEHRDDKKSERETLTRMSRQLDDWLSEAATAR